MSPLVLVAYGTKHGSTAGIAAVIAETLAEAGITADLRVAGEVRSVVGYDAVVLGSAVYMNRWRGDALDLLKRHERDLAGLPVWMFSSGPTGGTPEADEKVQGLLATDAPPPGDAGKRAARLGVRGHATFGGRLGEEAGGLFERWMPRGDWRDFDHVRAWAAGIAAAVTTSVTEPVGTVTKA